MRHPIIKKNLGRMTREALACYIADHFEAQVRYAQRITDATYGGVLDFNDDAISFDWRLLRKPNVRTRMGNMLRDVLRVERPAKLELILHLSCGHAVRVKQPKNHQHVPVDHLCHFCKASSNVG